MLRATITKYRVYAMMQGDSIIEIRRERMNTYNETETDIGGAKDKYTLSEKKKEFIEKVSRMVLSKNRQEENKFKRSRGASYEVLVVTNIN